MPGRENVRLTTLNPKSLKPYNPGKGGEGRPSLPGAVFGPVPAGGHARGGLGCDPNSGLLLRNLNIQLP